MNHKDLFEDIRKVFCGLWNYKIRGQSLEIITPFSSPNNKFISVFITIRNNRYIVTDGGWLLNGEYSESDLNNESQFQTILKYYESFYSLKVINHYKTTMFYKEVNDTDYLPNAINDLAHFISQSVSSYNSLFPDTVEEKKEKERFKKEVDNFIIGIVGVKNFKGSKSLGDGYDSVRFHGRINHGSKMSLVKYVTGSNFDNFRRSVTSASCDFEIADGSQYKSIIKNKFSIVNDITSAYDPARLYPYIPVLEKHMDNEITLWSQREKLYELLN